MLPTLQREGHTAQSRPSRRPQDGLSFLCSPGSQHTHAGAAWGTASVLGPHSCVDGGGFSFWNADRTNNSRKGFKTHSDAIFSGLLSHLPCIKAMSVFSPTCCLWSGRRVPVFLTAGLFGPKMTIFCTFLVKCILGDTLSGNSNSKAKW